MIFSGLTILADTNSSSGNAKADLLPMMPVPSYNLTFVANGLTHLFNGSDSWFVDYFTASGSGGIFPLYPTSNSVSTTVPAGTYNYQANDYFQSLYNSYSSPIITVDSNTVVYVNFTAPQSISFHEQGLNSTYKWGVYMSGNSPVYTSANNESGGTPIKYYAIGGNYQYTWFESQNGINTTLGSSDTFVGTANLSLSLPISSFSDVTFHENNLPSGTMWFMKQVSGPNSNGSFVQSSSSSITMRVMNGLNTFIAGYMLDSFRINLSYVTVSAGSVSDVQVDFPNLYSVALSSANLPASTYYYDWGVSGYFSYGPFHDTFILTNNSAPTINALLPEATLIEEPLIDLNFNAGGSISGYTVFSDQTYLAVSSKAGQTQTIHFGTLYPVTLNFPGMPSSDYLVLSSNTGNITSFEYSRVTPSATFRAPNGTFSFTYSVGTTYPGFSVQNVPFNFTVEGSSTTLNFQLYSVNFTNAYGPSGFTVSVGNPESQLSEYPNYFTNSAGPGQAVNSLLINGSYSYILFSNNSGPSNLYGFEYLGQLNVSGANQTIIGQIPTSYFNTTFDASGLPTGTNFQIQLGKIGGNLSFHNDLSLSVGSDSYIYLPAGEYSVDTINANYHGTQYFSNSTYFNVTGTTAVHLTLSVNAYLTVTEKGLPPGTTWSMVFNGNLYSTSRSAMVVSGNASQMLNFSINPVGSYYPDPVSGSITSEFGGFFFEKGTVNSVLPVVFTPKPLSGVSISASTLNVSSMLLGQGSQFSLPSTASTDTINVDSSNGLAYITYTTESNQNGPGLIVFNSSSYSVVSHLDFGSGGTPFYSTLDQANGMLYIALSVSANNGPFYYIASLNTANYEMQVTPVNISQLTTLAIDQKTNMLYAANPNAVYEIDPATMSITGTIFMNSTYSSYSDGVGLDLQYSQQTGLFYATGYIPNGVVAINPSTNSISANYTFPIGTNPLYSYVGGSTMDQQGGILYYTLQQYYSSTGLYLSSLIGFNTQTGKFQVNLGLGQGYAANIAFGSSNGFVYIPLQLIYDYSNPLSNLELGQLVIYDPATGLLANTTELAMDPYAIAFNPSNGNVLVGNYYSGSVTIFGHSSYGYIVGTVNDQAAVVSINGITVPVVDGHYAASVAAGNYYVSAFANGYAPVVQNVTVKAFSMSSVNLTLNNAETTYEVSGRVSPAGASVMFNGISASVNSTGFFKIFLATGEYTVSDYLEGYFPASQSVAINGNTELNLTLIKEPKPLSVVNSNNVSAIGFNVTVSTIKSSGNGSVYVQFNATTNGTLTVSIPFSDLANTNISDVIHSRVYINGVQYSDFSIIISSNYTVILKVMGLKGDPTLVWAYSPSYVAPPANASGYPIIYIVGAIAAVIVVLGALGIHIARKKKRN